VAEATRARTRLAREERREQIITAAIEVFRTRDPNEVTFEELADAAGVSRALVYNYFGDRHGLLEAVYRRHVSRLQRAVSGALQDRPVRRDAIYDAVRAHLDFAVSDPAGYRYAAGQTPFLNLPELQQKRVEVFAMSFGGDSADARLVARGIFSAVQGMVLDFVERGCTNMDRANELITGFLWEGIRRLDQFGFVPAPSMLVGEPKHPLPHQVVQPPQREGIGTEASTQAGGG
jgi:AcrR family transcriptional regulator